MDTLELANFAENLLGSQNKIIDLPYHPFYIKGNKLWKLFYLGRGSIRPMEEFQVQSWPDGTLLSLPIPGKFDNLSFDDLNYNGLVSQIF